VYLARHSLDVGYFRNFGFLQYFDGNILIGGFVDGRFNFAEGALADGFA